MKHLKFCKFILAISCFCIIAIGYIITAGHYREFFVEYALVTLLIGMGCLVLLPHLLRNTIYSLPVWIIFLVFVFIYIGKFYILSLYPEIGRLGPPYTAEAFVVAEDMFLVYKKIAIAFISFASVTALFYSMMRHNFKTNNFISTPPNTTSPNANIESHRRRIKIILTVAFFLIILTSYVSYRFEFVMGIAKEPLPFNIEGMTVYLRVITIPIMLISAMFLSKLYDIKKYMHIGVLFLFMLVLGDILIRGSKAGLFTFILLLLLYFWRAGYRFSISRLIFIAGGLILAMLSFPVIGAIRFYRHAHIPLLEIFSKEGFFVLTQFFAFETYQDAFWGLFMRMTGSDAFSVFIAHDIRPIGLGFIELLLVDIRAVGKYITHNVFLAPYDLLEIFGVAPSLLGTLYFIGGSMGIIVGMAILSYITLTGWIYLLKLPLLTAPVIQIFFPLYVVHIFSEGTIERFIFHSLPVLILSIIAIELLFKRRLIYTKEIMRGQSS